MNTRILITFLLVIAFPVTSQASKSSAKQLPKDPRAILAAAAPFYNLADPPLKPWHLKATYQLYDESGKPNGQGTFEYWWVSPTVYRSTWTRPGASRTDWHTADGKHFYEATGDGLNYFEFKLRAALLSPLPSSSETASAKVKFHEQTVTLGGSKMTCIQALRPGNSPSPEKDFPFDASNFFCFDPPTSVLRLEDYDGTLAVFDNVVEIRKRYLPREIEFFDGRLKMLKATVTDLTRLVSSDTALTPPQSSSIVKTETVPFPWRLPEKNLVRMEYPVYPVFDQEARRSGKVLMQAMIGADGKVSNVKVIFAPSPTLGEAAMQACSHWRYKPTIVNGKPAKVILLLNVFFILDG